MSYKNLEIWNLAKKLVIAIHNMTLTELPKFEMYEIGSQIRRSSKSVKSNIVEGYGKRYYKQDFIHHLLIALASNDETANHLETLFDTGSLKNEDIYRELLEEINTLGKKLNSFIQSVEQGHHSPR